MTLTERHAARLRIGDTIGIIAPSDPITPSVMEQFQSGVTFLRALGFRTRFAKNLFSNSLGYSASPEEKVEDFHAIFGDPTVSAVICAQGGNTANSFLSLVNWEFIRDNPKIFIGMSDITVLLNAIYVKTGLLTYYGNDLMWGFGREVTSYDQEEFLNRLVQKELIIQPSSLRQTILPGRASGRLLGGNVRCLLKLAGTEFFPDFNDAILFIEGMNSLDNLAALLTQMAQIGVFQQVSGIVLGYFDGVDRDETLSRGLQDLVIRLLNGREVPVMRALDFGHNCPNTILPVGAQVFLDSQQELLKIEEDFLS